LDNKTEDNDNTNKTPPKNPNSQPEQNLETIVINDVYSYIQTNAGQIPDTKITTNISWREMLGNNNTNEERKRECTKEVLTNVYRTAQQLQNIHDTYWQGRPLIISSGWRSVRNNRNCGGAKYSRHLYGQAVDFNLGLPNIKSDYNIMEKYWKGFIIFEGTWIHADIRGVYQ